MNILIVTQYFWPENFRINDLALGLRDRGHAVTVLTGIPNYPEGRFPPGYGFFSKTREDFHGVNVLRVPLVPRGRGGGVRLVANYLSFAFFAGMLGPLRCRGEFDVIFVYEPSPITVGLPAIILKKMKSAPILFWVQDLWPESLSATGMVRSGTILRMVEPLVRYIYRECDRILVQSMAFFPPLEKMGMNSSRLRYFPNSAEEIYKPVLLDHDAPERAELPPGFRVLFAGNIGAAQDFGTILDAAERLKEHRDIKWVILGDGRMRPWVEQQVRERGLDRSVHMLGRRPPESMPRYFSLADALLVTLRREPIFSLTVPSKVQSYLACAKPIVAALEGEGARVIEEAGAGVSVHPERPAALAEAVLAMYRLPELDRQAMGERGRRYFDSHFEREILLDRLDGWMREIKAEGEGCVS